MNVNPDLIHEREQASFPVNDMTTLFYGGKEALTRRDRLIDLLRKEKVKWTLAVLFV